jgi:thioesterase domain-containing protein
LAHKILEAGYLAPKALIEVNSEGHLRPLAYFHGDYHGRGYNSVIFARSLGSNQPVLIVSPHGMGDEPIPPTMEEMAADRLQLILKSQPEGPYRLCGNCLGGIVAFEVARLLIDAGKEVEAVILIDPPTLNANRIAQLLLSTIENTRLINASFAQEIKGWTWYQLLKCQQFLSVSWRRRWRAIKRHSANSMLSGRLAATDIGKATKSRSSVDRDWKYILAMSNYVPRPLAVRLIHFTADFNLGAWRRMSPNLEAVQLTGSHDEIDFAVVAEHLRERL